MKSQNILRVCILIDEETGNDRKTTQAMTRRWNDRDHYWADVLGSLDLVGYRILFQRDDRSAVIQKVGPPQGDLYILSDNGGEFMLDRINDGELAKVVPYDLSLPTPHIVDPVTTVHRIATMIEDGYLDQSWQYLDRAVIPALWQSQN